MGRATVVWMFTIAVCVAVTAFAADAPRHNSSSTPAIIDQSAHSRLATARPTRPVSIGTSASGSPGTIVGFTYYDLQHYGTLGRQIDNNNGLIQVAWTKGYTSAAIPRTIGFEQNSIFGPASTYTLDDGSTIRIYGWNIPVGLPPLFATENPGFVNTRAGSSIHTVLTYHGRPNTGPSGPLVAQLDTSSLGFEYFVESIIPQPSGSQYVDDPVLYPKHTLSLCGSDEILHVVGSSIGNGNEIWYWRGIVSATSPFVSWSAPTLLDHDFGATAAVEAHGLEAAVAYISDNGDDLMYVRSIDCGLTWQAPVNVTNYTGAESESTGIEVAMVYDQAGGLHILWNTFRWHVNGTAASTSVHLYHWGAATGIRTVTQAAWVNTCVNGTLDPFGANNGAGIGDLVIADPGLAVKPAGMGPGTGIPDELLYATWTQFGPTDNDCATADGVGTLGGKVNGEICWSVSSDGGLSWDRPTTVTGTHTPNCLPGDCASEAWQTVAATADSALYMSYVLDRHAGASSYLEGEWTENPYMILALETRLPVPSPQIFIWPLDFSELQVDNLGTTDSVTFRVYNPGNSTLNYQVDVTPDDGGPGHILINGAAPYINTVPPGSSELVTVRFEGIGIPDYTENNWRLEITSNDSLNDPGQGGAPINVTLQVFVVPEWYTCDSDTLSTGQHRLQVSSCLELGNQGLQGGFYSYADSTERLFTGSPVITWHEGGITRRAYRNIFMTDTDRTRDKNQSFRSIAPMTVLRDTNADRASGTAVTTDSIIQLDYEIVAIHDAGGNGAYVKLAMTNRTPDTLTGVSFGAIADFDLPEAIRNIGFADNDYDFLGLQAVTRDTSGFPTALDDYAALFHIDCFYPEVAGQVMDNADYVYPFSPPFPTDSLHELFDRFGQRGGFDAHTYNSGGADTASDLSLLMVRGHNVTLSPGDVYDWGFGMALSNLSEADLEARIMAIRAFAHPGCDAWPPECGTNAVGDVNANGSMTSADIIYLVGFVFKGGPEPQPCLSKGDVNCDGSVTSADIIFLVAYVFKGGPAPPESCP